MRIYKADKGIYVAPRIHHILATESFNVSLNFHSSIKKEEIYRNTYRTF